MKCFFPYKIFTTRTTTIIIITIFRRKLRAIKNVMLKTKHMSVNVIIKKMEIIKIKTLCFNT